MMAKTNHVQNYTENVRSIQITALCVLSPEDTFNGLPTHVSRVLYKDLENVTLSHFQPNKYV